MAARGMRGIRGVLRKALRYPHRPGAAEPVPAGDRYAAGSGSRLPRPLRKLSDAMIRAHRRSLAIRWLGAVLIVCLAVSGTIAPGTAPVARAQTGGDDELHPRWAMTERAFQRLKDVLSPEHPTVHPATLHFVDAPIANAWVNQAAEVYVAEGLLDLLETEEQIAGVLAHELAHVTQQHVPKQIRRYWGLALLVIAANIGVERSERAERQRFSMVHPLLMNAYSREAELEADQVALRYLEKAGYHPKGLLEALERLQSIASRQPVEELWMTHPLPELRLGALRRYLDPRMGIPMAALPSLGVGLRTEFEDPDEAAATFVYATWNDPGSLPERVGSASLPAVLLPGASPGLYPKAWPPDFPVRFRGVATEYEEHSLLTYTTYSRLELDTPLGVARFAVLRLTLKPAAQGWYVTAVEVLPPEQWMTGSPAFGEGNGKERNERSFAELPAAWRKPLESLLDAVAYGAVWPSLPSPGADAHGADNEGNPLAARVNVLLGEMVRAGEQLRTHGFTLTPLSGTAVPLDEATYRQVTPPTWQPPTAETAYFDVVLRWAVEGPEGERLTIERRVWVALQDEPGPAAFAGFEPLPL